MQWTNFTAIDVITSASEFNSINYINPTTFNSSFRYLVVVLNKKNGNVRIFSTFSEYVRNLLSYLKLGRYFNISVSLGCSMLNACKLFFVLSQPFFFVSSHDDILRYLFDFELIYDSALFGVLLPKGMECDFIILWELRTINK